MRFNAGLDLGQRGDYTALVIARRSEDVYEVVFARRWRGLGYTSIVEKVSAIVADSTFDGQIRLRIDSTGVGVAVLDLFSQARHEGTLRVGGLEPITFTAGLESDTRKGTVPKKDLVARAQVLMSKGQLVFARKLQLAPQIREELKNYSAKVSAAGRTSFEAAGSGHDDLVTALALAVHQDSVPLTLTRQDYMSDNGGTGTVNGAFVDWELGWTRWS